MDRLLSTAMACTVLERIACETARSVITCYRVCGER